nr:copper resistance CopC family protein [Kibdelosporangium sp. MJ126-NF4]
MFARRISAALLIGATAMLSTAVPALAHTELKGSTPAKDASVAAPPTQVQLTFSEPVQVEPGAISVAGPGGQWTVGQVTVDAAVVTAPVTPVGPAGQYTISYRVISADGDPVSGKVPFTLTVAAQAPTTPAPTTPSSPPTTAGNTSEASAAAGTTVTATPTSQQSGDSGGIPVWIWIAGAIVLAGAGVFLGLRAGKSKG